MDGSQAGGGVKISKEAGAKSPRLFEILCPLSATVCAFDGSFSAESPAKSLGVLRDGRRRRTG
jgi:hypothetical protein